MTKHTNQYNIAEELLIENFDEKYNIGATFSFNKIERNLDRISYDLCTDVVCELDRGLKVTEFATVGRFIVFVDVSPDFYVSTQLFIDTENDIKKALEIANHLFHDNHDNFNSFMKQFNELKNKYEKNYHKAELLMHYSLIDRYILEAYMHEVVN